MSKVDYTLYLVTDSKAVGNKDFLASIESAIQGGVTVVQLREKDVPSLMFYKTALALKEITSKYNVPLIINDRIDIAMAVDADGVHLGQSDLPVEVARQILGEQKIIGVSARTVEAAIRAQNGGATYLGVGAMFGTNTKNDTVQITVERLAEIKESVSIPIVAIGGISQKNLPELKGSNMDGIAVVSAILADENPKSAAVNLKEIMLSLK